MALADGGDFNLSLFGAEPSSYDHDTGGGAVDDQTQNQDVAQLQGEDFECEDVVTVFELIEVDDSVVPAGANQTINLDYSFGLDTTGASGAAITDVVGVSVNYGVIAGGVGEGPGGTDAAISDDGGSTIANVVETVNGTPFVSGTYDLSFDVTDLEQSESVVVRIDLRISCNFGQVPTGNLQIQRSDADVVAPAAAVGEITGGAETLNFQVSNIVLPGSIITEKQTDPDTGTTPLFTFDPSWSGTNFQLYDDQQNDSGALDPGIYSVSEVAPLPAQWSLTTAVCSSTDPNDPATFAPSSIDLGTGGQNEVVTCVFTNTLTENAPSITVVKTVDVPTDGNTVYTDSESRPEPGGTNSFQVVVTNTSDATDPVTITSLSDDTYPALTNLTCTMGGNPVTLPVTLQTGESFTCTFDGSFTGGPGDSETDTVTASGTDDEGTPVSNTDTAIVTLTDVPSSIFMTKSNDANGDNAYSDTESMPEPGGTVSFRVFVQNTSSVDSVTISTLTDNPHAALTNLACVKGGNPATLPITLAPGESFSCFYDGDVIGNAGDALIDQATVGGTDDDGNPLSMNDDSTVNLTDVGSSISVVKSVDVPNDGNNVYSNSESMPEPGGQASFRVVITNTSTVDVVTISTLSDDKYPALTNLACFQGVTPVTLPVSLDPGESFACFFNGTFTGNAGASQTDTATASGTDDDGDPVSGDDTAIVSLTNVASSIDVQKTVDVASDGDTVFHDSESMPEPGGQATFKVVVTNTSAIDTVTITTLSDDKYPALANLACVKGGVADPLPVTLTPGQSFTCTFTGSYFGSAGSSQTDTATASGTDDDSLPVSDSDTARVTIFDVLPTIVVTKTANPTVVPFTGGNVTFTVSVRNTSIEPVLLTNLVDDTFGNLDGKGTCDVPQVLQVNQTYTCSFTAFISGQLDPNGTGFIPHVDVAAGRAFDNELNPATDSDDATVTFFWRGRTPGFWKNQPDQWPTFSIVNYRGQTVNITTSTKVTSVFAVPIECTEVVGGVRILDLNGDNKADTLLDSVGYGGTGGGLCGALGTLLRAATSALLNEATFGAGYPPYENVQKLLKDVNQTLQTKDPSEYLSLAAYLDFWNNGVH